MRWVVMLAGLIGAVILGDRMGWLPAAADQAVRAAVDAAAAALPPGGGDILSAASIGLAGFAALVAAAWLLRALVGGTARIMGWLRDISV